MRVGHLRRDGDCLVPRLLLAHAWWSRLRGLLLRRPLAADASEALVIEPCASVHTFGMRYPLDLVFVDRHGVVLGVREHVRPWRTRAQPGARAVIEFHHGAVRRLGICAGDRLQWQ